MIRATQAVVGIGGQRGRRLFSLSASVPSGKIIGVVGANGVGKTTLLRCLAGFARVVDGELLIDGFTPEDYRVRSGIGYLPERCQFPAGLTSRSLLERAARLIAQFGSPIEAHAAIDTALRDAGVDFSTETQLSRLSNGQRQRASLSVALLARPRLILLDEPESALDPKQRTALREKLMELAAEGATVVISSHDIAGICMAASSIWLVEGQNVHTIEVPSSQNPTDLRAHLPKGWQ